MIWYDMIYDVIWYDMIWYDMIWYDMIWYDEDVDDSDNDKWYMMYGLFKTLKMLSLCYRAEQQLGFNNYQSFDPLCGH